MTYDVFLCHSMRDAQVARAISRGIATFARGTSFFRLRDRLRVFEASNLSPAADVSQEILSALEGSRFLIFIASPAAAQSAWVARELEVWLRSRRRDSLLIVLAEGTPETAFPPILRDFDDALWVDLRWATGISDFAARPEFVDAIASLTAAIRGVSKDVVLSERVRANQQIRTLGAASMILLVLSVLALTAAYLQFRRARQELEAALERAQLAQKRAVVEAAARASTRVELKEAEQRATIERHRARAAEIRAKTVTDELEKLLKKGGTAQRFRAYQEEIRSLKTRMTDVEEQLAASNDKRVNAEHALARSTAIAAEYERQLKQARAPIRQRSVRETIWSRVAATLKPYSTELITLAICVLVLFTLSSRSILLLLRLEYKPIIAVAVPLYLTRIGRLRLFREYQKHVTSREVKFHSSHYLDIPFVSTDKAATGQPLEEFITSHLIDRNIVIIAGGGRGKTTFCHRVLIAALNDQIRPNGKPVIPVIVDGLTYDGNLLRTITDALVHDGVPVNTGIVDAQLTAGMLMVIFDGWSEVQAFVDASDDKADAPTSIKRYPDTRFVFTSRTQLPGTLRLALRDPVTVELQDVDPKTGRDFVERYLVSRKAEADELIDNLVRSALPLPFTPLMLRLVAEVFDRSGQIPTHRTQLFNDYFRQLFRADAPNAIEVEAVEYAVKHLTRYTYLANHGRRGFPVYRGVQILGEIKNVLVDFGVQSLPIDLLKILSSSGLYKKSGDRLRCFHDSFESYFAAKVLYDEFNENRYEAIVACASDVTFAETYEFLLEITGAAGESDRLLEAIERTRITMQPASVGFRTAV